MAERGIEQIGGTVVTESADALMLGSTLRANLSGAMGWAIIAEIIIFAAKIAVGSIYPLLGQSYVVWMGGLVVWLLAFLYVSMRPPLVVRRDGQVLERGKPTNHGVRRVTVRQQGQFAVLTAQTGSSGEERIGGKVMFPNLDEANKIAERINVFLANSEPQGPKIRFGG